MNTITNTEHADPLSRVAVQLGSAGQPAPTPSASPEEASVRGGAAPTPRQELGRFGVLKKGGSRIEKLWPGGRPICALGLA